MEQQESSPETSEMLRQKLINECVETIHQIARKKYALSLLMKASRMLKGFLAYKANRGC